ncbi:hypothetical protein GCM10012275_02450 [Longimycelium tulufanense]|uniref:DUF4097 domain-containing protein n=1 Tax=Longimycelium tulufanense TaxID=907463 RepID=A0A8J3C5Q8_9PSEU|nr:DUF4097 family beta strand repeat-containing protein [Longimycelium tulufanense]GGM34685.1 hypothetical protein GCM10012275_02450 [Longimycelium tulufanense]
MRTLTHTDTGTVRLELELSVGVIEVCAEDRDRAEVTLTPATPGDEVAAELIRRAQVHRDGWRMMVTVPRPASAGTTVIRTGGGVTQTCINTGGGMVFQSGGHTIINGHVISGNTNTTPSGGAVRAVARVPRGSTLVISTETASAWTHGALERIQFRSEFGNLRAASADVLNASTVSGDITAHVAGSVTVHTTSGDVELGPTHEASVTTVSGDVEVTDLGGTAQAMTVSGDVHIQAIADSQVTATTISGDIRVTAEPGVSVRTRTQTVSGRVRTPDQAGA